VLQRRVGFGAVRVEEADADAATKNAAETEGIVAEKHQRMWRRGGGADARRNYGRRRRRSWTPEHRSQRSHVGERGGESRVSLVRPVRVETRFIMHNFL
jgi:hypothetical protein